MGLFAVKKLIEKHFYVKRRLAMVLAVFFIVLGYGWIGSASIARLYPQACLGEWESPSEAAGEPNGVYAKGKGEPLFCGEFKGDIPKDKTFKSAKLHMLLSLDGEDSHASSTLALISYTLDGTTWEVLGELAPEEETSFLLPLTSWDDVAQIQVSVKGSEEGRPFLLDAMWLEASYEAPPSPGFFAPKVDIDELPRIAVDAKELFASLQTTFRADEEPTFEILLGGEGEQEGEAPIEKPLEEEPSASSSPEALPVEIPIEEDDQASSTPSLLSRVLGFSFHLFSSLAQSVFAQGLPESRMVKAQIIDPQGGTDTLTPVITEKEGNIMIRIPKPGRAFTPGKYQLHVEVLSEEEDKVFVSQKDFTWGVLAINTNKASYLPGEEAYLQMAVLKDDGHTVCDADLVLRITHKESGKEELFSTAKGTIAYSGECAKNNVTNVPDYFAYYSVGEVGTYEMVLMNLENGYVIKDSFEVKESLPFEIERVGPTRIYPPASYEMKFIVKANEDFAGEIMEEVPELFEVKSQNSKIKNTSQKSKVIYWDAEWEKGGTYEFSYEFDAPDISPEFYLLGPLTLQASSFTFQESRSWQIASDAAGEITVDDTIFDPSGEYNPSPNTAFISNTTGYVFYIDSTSDVVYRKTTDGGATWGTPVALTPDKTWGNVAIWYERWTPGDTTGTKIHIAAAETLTDDIWYHSLDTSGDTLDSDGWVATITGTSYVPTTDGGPSIVKSTDGNLFILGFTTDVGKVFKSTDGGDTWADTSLSSDVHDQDRGQLLPLSGGDILLILHDGSTNTGQSKVYDEGADTWGGSWATIGTWTFSQTNDLFFGASLYKSTNDVYLAANDAFDSATGDIKAYKFSDSTRAWSTLTDIYTDPGANTVSQPTMMVDQKGGDLYAIYLRGSLNASMDVYYRKSTDGGTTWSAESNKMNATVDDFKYVRTNLMFDTTAASYQRGYVTWLNDDLNDLLANRFPHNIYYVRKTGSDTNDGVTPSTAFLTIGKAEDVMVAGDTVYVGAGTYSETVVLASGNAGTASLAITYNADSDGTRTGDAGDVIIKGSTNAIQMSINSSNDYIIFDGFGITGASVDCILIDTASTNNIIRNNKIYNCEGDGIELRGSSSSDNIIRGNEIFSNGNHGVHVSSGNTLIENNIIFGHDTAGGKAGVHLNTSSAITIKNNFIFGNNRGISMATGCTCTFQDNTIRQNTAEGFFDSAPGTATRTIKDNTITDNDEGVEKGQAASTYSSTKNIVFGNTTNNYAGNSYTHDDDINSDPFYAGALTGGSGTYSLEFDNSNDEVRVLDNAALELTNMTVEAWIRSDGAANTDAIVARYPGVGSRVFAMQIDSAKKLQVNISDDGTNSCALTSTNATRDGAWNHVAFSMDDTGDTLYVAVNGVVNSAACTRSPKTDSTADLRIGAEAGFSFFDGLIDEVRISNIPLYKSDYIPKRFLTAATSTVALYHFNEGTGQTVKDSSTNGLDGTLGATSSSASDDPLWRARDITFNTRVQASATNHPNNSPALDAGSQTSSNAGLNDRTVRADSVADSGTVDIGFHYPRSTVTQNIYRWYDDNDALQPTTAKAAENTAITNVATNDKLRLRISLQGGGETVSVGTSFKLQYAARVGAACGGGDETFADIGPPGSGIIWRAVNTAVADGRTISAGLLSATDVFGHFAESATATSTASSLKSGDDIEFDWAIQNNGATGSTTYCFQVVYQGGQTLETYSNYPRVTTSGGTIAYTQSAYRFFENADSTNVGSALAGQDTAATAPAQGTPFRLRMLIHVDTVTLSQSGQNFKLQVAERSGTCDTSFSGESYADVSPSSGAIRFYDNTTPSDGAALTANANDPTHSSDTIVNQTYEEANNFTNSQAAISAGEDGKWDFALVDNSASSGTAYCFRIVKSDDTVLDTYDVIPQVTTASRTLTQSAYRFFANANSTDVGSALAAQDSAATAPAQGTPFRLRMLLHVGSSQLPSSGQTFKLQFAQRSGTCDTGFSGETYADVGQSASSTAIRFADNTTPSDGAALTANANDPTHSSDTIVNQTYEEANNFTNSQAAIPAGQDGKWDFVLVDNSANANTTYCFRIVKSDNSALDTYDVIPQVTTAAPTVQFTASSSSGSEATTSVNLEVSLSLASSLDVTVTYSATGGTATGSGTDYTLADGTATISSGTTTNIALTIVNDSLDENDETIEVTLSSPSNATLGANTVHTYTITDDDDAPSLSIDDVSVNETESSVTATFTITLSVASGKNVNVDYATSDGTATAGSDYTAVSATTLTITAGNTTSTVNITVLGDALDEDDETFNVDLSNPVNATISDNKGVGTIVDNDSAPSVSFDSASSSGSEATTSVNLAVSLSAASGKTITVAYSATGGTATGSGTDYTLANGTLTFSAGDTSENIALTIVNDSTDENDETIEVTLSSPSNATLGANTVHTYTITDDDAAGGGGGGGGGGGVHPNTFAIPRLPLGVLINGGAQRTFSRNVTLSFNAGANVDRMSISNFPDFRDSTIEPYASTKAWILTPSEGEKTVYVRFYTRDFGQVSQTHSARIIYQLEPTPPLIVPPSPTPPQPLPPLVARPIFPQEVTQPIIDILRPLLPPIDFTLPPIARIPDILAPLIPGDIRSRLDNELRPAPIPIEEFVTEEAPLALRGQWQLLPQEPIRQFVFAPLPTGIRILAQKFPQLERTFGEVGISRLTDVSRLRSTTLTLPGLTQAIGVFPTPEPGARPLPPPPGIPLAELSPQLKEQIPSEVVFAKAAGGKVDFDITLSITGEGVPEQTIQAVSGKSLTLVIKPESPAKSIKGFLLFKSAAPRRQTFEDVSIHSLFASSLFSPPLFATTHNPQTIEERLVLLEFEYEDPDGDGIYTADIQTPVVAGEYEILTVIEYEDPDLGTRAVRLTTVIDPEGYVYEQIGSQELRIAGAIVSLFWLNPDSKEYQLWPARDFQQENPQVTDVTGKYSFLVPQGTYYLKVEAPGYPTHEGKPFEVKTGAGVHMNIEMQTTASFIRLDDWKTILLILLSIGYIMVTSLLIYNFYRDRIRETLIKKEK